MLRRSLLTGVFALGLSGCAVTRLEPPQLQVLDVALVNASVLRQDLRLRMRVHNPNNRALPVRGLTYEVQLAGETVANGASERDIDVPAMGETEFSVDVTANAAAALLRVLGNRDGRDLEYRVLGRAQLASGLIRSIPFEQKGILRMR